MLAGLLVGGSAALSVAADDLEAPDAAEAPLAEPAAPALPAPTCEPGSADLPIASEIGSAGIMYNIAEHPSSIRAVAGRLLNEALDRQKKAASAATACGDCRDDVPRVVYKVAPIHLLPEPKQQAVCRKLDAQTRVQPFEFPPRRFESISALNDWVMAFSQGRGEEGKELYRRCEANCSPHYQFTIEPDDGGLQVETRVHCGLARDRDSNDYEVSTALRLECDAPSRPVAEVLR
ncbi:MAG: hypothetical protein AB7I32_15095 [Gammaproteobacteria bacterium]